MRQGSAPWLAPHVVANPSGEVVFEWRYETRLLTAYVTPQGTEFVQAWGTDIAAKMRDGEVGSAETRQRRWAWLISH